MRNPLRRGGGEKRRVLRKDRTGAKPVTVALLVLLVAGIGVYLGFTKDIPLTSGFQMKAVFESSNSIRANSPVRIAGVEVGKVKKVERYKDTNMSVVTMEIKEKGLPIHKDATAKIRSRIFLEGNFFVDLSPGSPQAPTIDDGDTLRVTQTSSPVQLDEILTTLQEDTREDLKTLLDEYGKALQGDPADSDRLMDDADESTRGETGAESLNDAADDAAPALRGVSLLNEAFLGTEEHDVSKALKGLQKITAALGRNEGTLQDFLENFNTTLAIFSDEKSNVSATIRKLPGVLATADRTFASLNAAFPSTRAFAREILPGVRETDPTIQAAFPWIRQVRGLVGPDELQGLARDLRPTARDLAIATDAAVQFFPKQNLFARCLNEVILPTGDIKIVEPAGRKVFETGVENYKEFWYTMVGLAGESQNFDGNGQYVRFQPGGGTQTLSTGTSNSGSGQLVGNPAATPIGVRPVWRGDRPAYRPDVDCYKNPLPDINSARTGGPNFGQGPSSGDGTPSGSPSTPVGPVPALPQLPSLPTLGTPAAKARAAKETAAKPRAAASGSTATRPRAGGARTTTRTIRPAPRAPRRAAPSSSVTMELLSRLNPYRGAAK